MKCYTELSYSTCATCSAEFHGTRSALTRRGDAIATAVAAAVVPDVVPDVVFMYEVYACVTQTLFVYRDGMLFCCHAVIYPMIDHPTRLRFPGPAGTEVDLHTDLPRRRGGAVVRRHGSRRVSSNL